MKFLLYKIEGYEAAIMALRMSKGKYYSWEKAQDIQDLVYAVTDQRGFIADELQYLEQSDFKRRTGIVTGDYREDVAEFKRLLGLTMNNAMGEFTHHTLMKYLDITFFTEDLHRGAQDDLDAHAIAFNNRITRFSTRLAEIEDVQLSEWYQDKLIPFGDVLTHDKPGLHYDAKNQGMANMPDDVYVGRDVYKLTPFGYVLERYAQVPAKNGLAKDVQRGGLPIGMASNAIWKIDLASLRYVYHMRSKLTKTSPELKLGLEQLADQLESHLPVFGENFRNVYTDSKQWEHTNKVKTVTSAEFQQFKAWERSDQFKAWQQLQHSTNE